MTIQPPLPVVAETRFGHGLDDSEGELRIIPGDHGRPPGRPRESEPAPRLIHNVVRSL